MGADANTGDAGQRVTPSRTAASATAAATAGATRGSSAIGTIASDVRLAATTAAIASAAAIFIASVIRVALGVQGAAEHAGEREHVVDLVREVAATGRDHGRVAAPRSSGCTSGVGLARAKIAAARRHAGQRLLGDRAAGDADEHVGPAQRVGDRRR